MVGGCLRGVGWDWDSGSSASVTFARHTHHTGMRRRRTAHGHWRQPADGSPEPNTGLHTKVIITHQSLLISKAVSHGLRFQGVKLALKIHFIKFTSNGQTAKRPLLVLSCFSFFHTFSPVGNVLTSSLL